ncbi:P-loop containing nucleoside triphosphate hydrolase protein [Pisolithus thermaeus]|nr:P-loop containing nucleoside triphosphate hydrolase protein [Pisolithus thermaeus]
MTPPSDAHSRTSPVVASLRLSPQISLSRSGPRSAPAPTQPSSWRLSNYRESSRSYTAADHWPSRRNSTLSFSYVPSEEAEGDGSPSSGLDPLTPVDHIPRPTSASESPIHAIATPKPTLLFAIASDDVEQVRKVLESGEAGPNDPVGPQSALAFTLTNDRLARKNDIVKVLLAYGADPSALRNPALNPTARTESNMCPPLETTLEGMDPATRYFVARADNAHTRQTSRLIYRSFFRPLTRVRYDVVGQDWALEQLFRVLSMHSQRLAVAPIVVLLCGPSGHGKSLLARKFGSLLEVPTHTVNMTTLRSTHDIWQSHSMSPYEEPSSHTLAEFLLANEGKRCVVVLDEIEKTEDQKALWSLLMPWELGRCSLGAGARHVDVRNVIWLGTSNIGHELVFDHHQNRPEQDKPLTHEEYLQLMEILRPRVSECLGASLLSRVTTVLPFVPFTLEEKKAIAAESVYALGGDGSRELSSQEVEALVMRALPHYVPSEGARSLHRAISNQLVDAL